MNNNTEYTNISIEPLGELDGIPIRPCMKSGFCCTKAPCMYGEWNQEKTHCKYLADPNDLGQRDCLRYQLIIDNVPDFEIHPAFGTGCSSAIGNVARNEVIKRVREMENNNKITNE